MRFYFKINFYKASCSKFYGKDYFFDVRQLLLFNETFKIFFLSQHTRKLTIFNYSVKIEQKRRWREKLRFLVDSWKMSIEIFRESSKNLNDSLHSHFYSIFHSITAYRAFGYDLCL